MFMNPYSNCVAQPMQERRPIHSLHALVWNVQGADSQEFLNFLKEHIRMQKPSILAPMETHIVGTRAQTVMTDWAMLGVYEWKLKGFKEGYGYCGNQKT